MAAWSAALLGVVGVFVATVFGLGPENDVVTSYDVREVVAYHREFYRQALLEGRLPLWAPHTFSGWPFAASPQTQTFYPATLGSLVAPFPALIVLDLVAHLWLAAVGTYLLLRMTFGLGAGAAAFGGMAFALSGRFVAQAYAGHAPFWAAAAYLPLLLLAVDRAVARAALGAGVWRAGPWLWVGGLLAGLQLLSGGFPLVWLTWLFVGLYRIGDTLRRAPTSARAWGRELGVLSVIVAMGTTVAAVQVLPAIELLGLSTRASSAYEYAVAGSFPPALLPTLLFAGAGDPRQEYFWEYYAYPGVVPLALAVVGLTQAARERRIIVLAVIAALAILFMLGGYGVLFPLLWKYVPGFGVFRNPARAGLVLVLCVAIAAAIGLHAVVERLRFGPRWRTALVVSAGLVTLVDVIVCARANRGRLLVPDGGLVESAQHRQLSHMLQADRSWYRFWFPPTVLRQNHAFQLGVRSVGGYDALYLGRYGRFAHAMTDTPPPPNLVTVISARTFLNAATAFPFKVLGVKYASHDGRIWTHPSPIRRAWFVTRARRVHDEASALAYMRGERFVPYGEAVFESPEADGLGLPASGEPDPPAAESNFDIAIDEFSPEHLRIRLGPHPAGYLVLSEIFYPGWRATIGGKEVPIHRADSILRSLPLRADENEIEMVYRPSSLRLGAAISLAALVLASAGLWASRRRPQRP
jgi:hypothetical protein